MLVLYKELWLSVAITPARSPAEPRLFLKMITAVPILVTFVNKDFPLTAPLAFQMLGFYKKLWLSGAVTPARRSDDLKACMKMNSLFIPSNFY